MKRYIVSLIMFLVGLSLMADEVSFKSQAPAQVILGKPFQLTYTVNQRGKDLRAPEMDGFDVLAGPYTSTSSSTSWVNGTRTSTFTQTYTYTLAAQKEGTFTIPPATITIDRQQYTSNGVKIKVLPPDEQSVQEQSSGNAGQTQQSGSQQTSNENIFVRTIVSKTKVSEQECLLLQYKLYFAGVDVTQLTNNTKLPEFKGFLKQEIDLGEIQTELEHYNGRNYQTAVLYKTLLYPQHSGEIQIEPASFEAVLRVQNRAQVRSIFDDFFGSYTNVTRALTASGVKIQVEALPKGKPASFAGGVGRFTMTSDISSTNVQQDDAVTLRLEITGSGNMKLLKTPSVDFPEGFEEYDPKVNNNFKTTSQGMSGTKTIEYLFIPRAGGDYTIPPVEFSYYDTQEKTYRTLSTPEFKIHVNRTSSGNDQTVVNNYVGKEDIKQLGTDIRYIYTGNLDRVRKAFMEFGSTVFWLCYLLPLLVSIILFIVFRRQIRERSNLSRMRYKRANKVAQKRLKRAKQLMEQQKREQFYEEIDRASLLYLSDRLQIPMAELNKEQISEVLRSHNIKEELIKETLAVLSEAEFARYAPASLGGEMKTMYERTNNLIDKLEDEKL